MRLTFTILASLSLAACAGDMATRATTSLAIACGSVGQALASLAPYRASLPENKVAVIEGIRQSTEPACAPGSSLDPVAATSFVEGAAAQLNSILETL